MNLANGTATFDVGGYNQAVGSIAGSGTITTSLASTAATLTTGYDNTSTSYAGVIQNGSGTLSLVKTGTGTLTLTGKNTFTGTTTINSNSGNLLINNTSGVGLQSAVIVNNNGALGGTGTVTGAVTLNSGGQITPGGDGSVGSFNTATLTFTNGGQYNWDLSNASGVAGTGWDLLKSSTLTASGTYTININGSSSIQNWNPHVNNSWTIATANAITGFNAASFNYTVNNLTGGGTFSLQNNGTYLTLNYSVGSGVGADAYWSLTGTGTWTTSTGTKNWVYVPSGGTSYTWSNGDDATFSASTKGTGSYTVNVDTSSGSITANSITVLQGAPTISGGALTLVGGTLMSNSGSTTTINSVINGSGGLRTQGTGTFVLGGANQFTGAVTLTGSTLGITDSGAFGNTANAVAFAGSGTLKALGGSVLTVANSMTINSSVTTTMDTTSNDMTLSGAVRGSGALVVVGGGVLTLGGASSYTGGTTIEGSTLKLLANTTGAGGALTFGLTDGSANAGTFDLTSASMTAKSLTVQTGSSTANTLAIGSGQTLTINGPGTVSTGTSLAGSRLSTTGNGNFVMAGGTISDFQIAIDTPPSDGGTHYVDFTSLNSVNITAGDVIIGGVAASGYDFTGTLTMSAGVNTITANLLGLGYYAGLDSNNGAKVGKLILKGRTTIDSDSIYVGYDKSGTSQITLSSGGTVTIRNRAGSGAVTTFTAGGKGYNSSNSIGGIADFSVGKLDARITTLNLAVGGAKEGGTGSSTGTLKTGSTADSNSDITTINMGTSANTAYAYLYLTGGTLRFTTMNNVATTGSQVLYLQGGTLSSLGAGVISTPVGVDISLGKSNGTVVQFGQASVGTGDITFNGSGTLVNNTTINTVQDTAFTGVLADGATPYGLTKIGSAVLTLSANNTFSGGATIAAGILSVATLTSGGSASGIGNSGSQAANLVLDGGTLQYTGVTTTTDRLFTLGANDGYIDASGSGTLTFGNTGSITLTGAGARNLTLTGTQTGNNTLATIIRDGTGSITSVAKSGSGLWVLSGANTYTGGTTINAGTLEMGNATALGANNSAATVTSGAVLDLNGTTMTSAGTYTLTINGNGSGKGALINTADYTAAQFYGTVALGSAGTITAISPITLGATGTLSGISGNSALTLNAFSAQIDVYGNITTLSLTKTGDNILRLESNNSFTGGFTITSAGYVIAKHGGALGNNGTGSVFVTNGSAILALGTDSTFNNPITVSADGVEINNYTNYSPILDGNITLNGSLTLNNIATANNRTLTVNGTISGSDGLTALATTAGYTITLSGANTYLGGTRINGGILVMNNARALGTISAGGNTGSVNLNSGTATLVVNTSGTIGALTGVAGSTITGGTSGAVTLTSSGTGSANTTFAGVMQNGVSNGTLSFVKTGTGSLTLSGNNSYTGGTTLSGGMLTIGGAGSLNSSGTISIASGGTFNYASSAPQTLNGTISGQGALIKAAGNTLTLTANNSYSGQTVISGGTLSLGSAGFIGSSATITVGSGSVFDVTASGTGGFTLNSGKTLKGSGTVSGNLTIGGGSYLSPGSSPGTLNDVGTVTYNGSGHYVWEINSLSGTKGNDPGWDFHNITGNLVIGANAGNKFNIDITGLNGGVTGWNPHQNGSWTITTASGGITGFATASFALGTTSFAADNSLGSGAFFISQSGDAKSLILNFGSSTTVVDAYWAVGTSGNWGTTTSSWTYNSAGTGGSFSWSATVADNAIFSAGGALTGAFTATISTGGVTANSVSVEEGSPTIAGGTLTLSGGTITVDSAATIGAVVKGTAGLVKAGVGALTLSAANVYSGGTRIIDGTLQVGDGGATGSLGTGSITDNGDLVYSFNSATALTMPTAGTGSGSINSASTGNIYATASTINLYGNLTVGGSQTYLGTASNKSVQLNAANITLTGSSISITGGIGTPNSGQDLTNTLTLDTSDVNGTINLTDLALGRSGTWYRPKALISNAGTGTINISGAGNTNPIYSLRDTPVTLIGGVNISATLSSNVGLTINSTANGTITGVLANGLDLTKLGAYTLTVKGANTYTGDTTIDQGTLAYTQNFTTGTALKFGAAAGSSSYGALNLGSASFTADSLTVQNNSTFANTINIGSGKTLTIDGTGGLRVGVDLGGTSTTVNALTISGSGALLVANTSAIVTIGLNQGTDTSSNNGTLDLTGLSSVTLGSSTAIDELRIAYGQMASGTLKLSNTAATITATTIRIGDSTGVNNGTGYLILGTGNNDISADTINIGLSKADGTLKFASQTAGSPGTVTIGGKTGAETDINLGYGVTATGLSPSGIMDLRGHLAYVTADVLTMGYYDQTSAGSSIGELYFDGGTLTVNTINMADKNGTGTGAAYATLNIGGGTFTVNNTFTLASQTGSGAAGGTLTITGGRFISNANIVDGGTTTTSTINLQGGTLEMSGKNIGSAANPINSLNFQVGTLQNVGSINGTAGVTKNSAGSLTLAGVNNFSGGATLTTGQLNINSARALGTGTFTIANGTTIDNTSGGAVQITSTNPQNWTGNFTFAGGNGSLSALNLGTGTVALGASARTATITASTLTVGGTISGNAGVGLTKAGGGTLTLGGNNTYTGATTINAGVLALSGTGSISGSPTISVASGATFNVANLTSTFNLANNRLLIGSGAGTFNVVGNINVGGTISMGTTGIGTMAVNNGTVTFINGGHYVWDVGTVTAGGGDQTANKGVNYDTLNINGKLNLGSLSAGGFTIAISSLGAITANWNPHDSGTWTLASASGGISGFSASAFAMDTTSFVTFNSLPSNNFTVTTAGNNLLLTYTGVTDTPVGNYWAANTGTWDSGTTSDWSYNLSGSPLTEWYANDNAIFSANSAGTGSITVNVDPVNGVIANSLLISSTSGTLTFTGGTITLSGGTVTVNSGSLATINSIIAGALSTTGLTKAGTGTLTLSGANTYTGGTTINAGILQVSGGDNRISAGNGMTISAAGVFDLNGQTQVLDALNGSGTISLGAGALTVGTLNASSTYSGIIVGTGSLTKTGAGTLTLSGVNPYTGVTIINDGVLQLNTANGTVGQLSGTPTITINSAGTLLINKKDVLGYTSGKEQLNIQGGVVQTLGTYRQTIVNPVNMVGGTMTGGVGDGNGAFSFSNAGTIYATSDATGNPAVINASSISLQSSSLVFNVTCGSQAPASDMNVSSAIILYGGSGGITKTGNGILTLSGANTYTGGTAIQNGSLIVGATGNLGATTGTVTMGTGSAGTIATVGNLTLNNTATIGALTVQSNTSTFTGEGNINQLSIASGKTLTASSLTVALPSTGTQSTRTALGTGSTPGAGGTLTVNGNVTIGLPVISEVGGLSEQTVADLSGLNGFNVISTGAGYLRVGYDWQNKATLTLANNNTINVGTISVGDANVQNYNLAGYSTLNLGAGANSLQAPIIVIGQSKGAGIIQFATITGSVTITGANNSGSANITIGNHSGGTYHGTVANTLSLSGHSAVVTAGTVTIGTQASSNAGGSPLAAITFDTGTFTAASIQLATVSLGNANSGATGTFTLGSAGTSTGVLNVNGDLVLAKLTNASSVNFATGSFLINGGLGNINGNIVDNSTGYASGGTVTTVLTLNGGTLNMAGHDIGSATRSIGTFTFTGGVLQNIGTNYGTITLGGAAVFNQTGSNTGTISGLVKGLGSLTKNGSGSLILTAANTYTGTTGVQGGGRLIVSGTGAIAPTTGAALTIIGSSGTGTFQYDSTATSTFGAIVVGNGTGTAGSTLNQTAGTIIGTSLTLNNGYTGSGTGFVSLSGGTTTISGAVVISNATANDNTLSTFTISGNGVLNANGGLKLTGLPGTGRYADGQFVQNGGTVNVAGSSGLLLTQGTLGNTARRRGEYDLNGGTLYVNIINSTSTGASDAVGTFSFGGGTLKATGNTASFWANSAQTTATITSAGATIDDGGYAITIGQVLQGDGSLAKVGEGALTLSGENSYSGGTTISGGKLQMGASGVLADTGTVTIGVGTATFDVNNMVETIGALVGSSGGTVSLGTGALTVNQTGATAFNGVITGAGSLTKTGVGVLTLGGANSYTGATTISGGTLALGSSDRLSDSSAVIINASNATFDLGGYSDTIGSLAGSGTVTLGAGGVLTTGDGISTEYAGAISGSGSVTKQGAGTWTLTGNNTHSGLTTVSAGKLMLNNTSGVGLASSVSVGGSATLGGKGTLSGAVSVDGTLRPGDESAPGTLTVGGLTLGSGAQCVMRIANGASHDMIVSTGAVDLGGATLTLDKTGFAVDNTSGIIWLIVTGGNAVTVPFSGSSTVTLPNGDWTITYTADYEGGKSFGGDDVALIPPAGTTYSFQ